MVKFNQTVTDLNRHLSDNIGFLKASCESFDAGFIGEAKRLATTMRVLLHDTQQSKSLLGLLGRKHLIKYVNTATAYDPQNLLPHHGLVGMRWGAGDPSYWAPLGDGPPPRYNRPPCDFDTWWAELVINDKTGGEFSRRDLVLALANKDGGAHVDPQLDAKYADLTRNNSIGWTFSKSTDSRPLADVELHSVRQISYEILRSLGMT